MPRNILSRSTLKRRLAILRRQGMRIVFTNGCFDFIHPGHVRYLETARGMGDVLVVGVNSDRSVRRLKKGPERPVMRERDRAEVLAALRMVDFVTLFDEETPIELIRSLRPDVLAKGGDWPVDRIVGANIVNARGGKVVSVSYVKGYSTSVLLRRYARAGARF